jgi:hypothetical protein
MPSCSEDLKSGKARCTVCDGKFGLVRYYSWRTPLCSRKCVDRFRSRRDSYRNWVWLQSALTSGQRTARGLHEVPDLTTSQRIFGNSPDFAPRRQNYDRPSCWASA